MKQFLIVFSIIFVQSAFAVKLRCRKVVADSAIAIVPEAPDVTPLKYKLKGLEVASVVDPTRSTGSTLFFFPDGAYAQYDSRGGSVASIETTLMDPGSYSNEIDGIVFSGGSTMGLAATDGVRGEIFKENIRVATQFDFIPSVLGAVVYDYGGRIHQGSDSYVYPTHELGAELTKHLSTDTFPMGRTGAGVTTTTIKGLRPVWGGQGAAFKKFEWGSIFTAVVLNAGGDIIDPEGNSYGDQFYAAGTEPKEARTKQNTTLSIIVTDVPLDRSQLKRLSIMVHTGMAKVIDPFHTLTDGDINFAVSLSENGQRSGELLEMQVQLHAKELMREAIYNAVQHSNFPIKTKKKKGK